MPEWTAIIMAGGAGTRIDSVRTGTAKPLLFAEDQSLVIRQVTQASTAGVSNIIITTRPELRDQFERHIAQTIDQISGIAVLANPNHLQGPIPALQYASELYAPARLIVTMADIYYFTNPFAEVLMSRRGRILLGGKEINRGTKAGSIQVAPDGRIQRIEYRALENDASSWSGLIAWTSDIAIYIHDFLKSNDMNSTEEHFVQYCIEREVDIWYLEGPPFVNVNTFEDLAVAAQLRRKELTSSACSKFSTD